MRQEIETLTRLSGLRGSRVQQMMGRVTYQQGLCQRYRNNIASLNRLCGFSVSITTPVQRNNQNLYKATLHRMLELQQRELKLAEENLARIQADLLAAMRSEKIVNHVIDAKIELWQRALAQQEQKIQDGMAAQAWWRAQGA